MALSLQRRGPGDLDRLEWMNRVRARTAKTQPSAMGKKGGDRKGRNAAPKRNRLILRARYIKRREPDLTDWAIAGRMAEIPLGKPGYSGLAQRTIYPIIRGQI